MTTNGTSAPKPGAASSRRADEADDLLNSIKDLVVDFIRTADNDAASNAQASTLKQQSNGLPPPTLLEPHPPKELQRLLNFSLPQYGLGREGLLSTAQQILNHSVNTWSQGFLDKLYASPHPVSLAADALLTALNTNVHVYDVSPALTVIERATCRAMASLFGLEGPCAGGISQPGGSAANQTSMVVARNSLFPETKTEGLGGRKFVLFTSEHGHYSVEKGAQMFGFGSKAVRTVAVDAKGRMKGDALEEAVLKAKEAGETPFYVNATVGTTVLGSFDPLEEIADVCAKHGLWMHVDGSWGGSVVFSEEQREEKLKGIERADSIAVCPHKMLNVALTCSLLLGKDLRQFHKAMTLPAGYLFHNSTSESNGDAPDTDTVEEFWDLGDLTPQCGRRGDSLKLALSWIYYGTAGYAAHIDHAFSIAAHLASVVAAHPKFTLVSEKPPPCLQICFYYDKKTGGAEAAGENSRTTERIKDALVAKGFMIDYAPGEEGKFFRVVVNGQTRKGTVENLIKAIEDVGGELDR